MAKERIKVLLWTERYIGNVRFNGRAYFYSDLSQLMKDLLLGGTKSFCLDDRYQQEFLKAFQEGKIKYCEVEKNINSNKEKVAFDSLKDGDYYIDKRVSVGDLYSDFNVMDQANRQRWYHGMYCKLTPPRDLDDSEKEIISKALEQSLGTGVLDKVFNLFALLCYAKNVVWKNYQDAKTLDGIKEWYNDKRDRSFLGFTTMDLYHKEDVETRERVAERTARFAYQLTKELTGYELKLKDYPDDDFVEGLMSARYLQNDSVIVNKVGKPTMTMKDLLKKAKSKINRVDNIAAQLCLGECINGIGASGNGVHWLDDLTDMTGVQRVTVSPYRNQGVTMKDFEDLDNCYVWNYHGNEKQDFILYIWDEMITARDMLDNDEAFVKLITGK